MKNPIKTDRFPMNFILPHLFPNMQFRMANKKQGGGRGGASSLLDPGLMSDLSGVSRVWQLRKVAMAFYL